MTFNQSGIPIPLGTPSIILGGSGALDTYEKLVNSRVSIPYKSYRIVRNGLTIEYSNEVDSVSGPSIDSLVSLDSELINRLKEIIELSSPPSGIVKSYPRQYISSLYPRVILIPDVDPESVENNTLQSTLKKIRSGKYLKSLDSYSIPFSKGGHRVDSIAASAFNSRARNASNMYMKIPIYKVIQYRKLFSSVIISKLYRGVSDLSSLFARMTLERSFEGLSLLEFRILQASDHIVWGDNSSLSELDPILYGAYTIEFGKSEEDIVKNIILDSITVRDSIQQFPPNPIGYIRSRNRYDLTLTSGKIFRYGKRIDVVVSTSIGLGLIKDEVYTLILNSNSFHSLFDISLGDRIIHSMREGCYDSAGIKVSELDRESKYFDAHGNETKFLEQYSREELRFAIIRLKSPEQVLERFRYSKDLDFISELLLRNLEINFAGYLPFIEDSEFTKLSKIYGIHPSTDLIDKARVLVAYFDDYHNIPRNKSFSDALPTIDSESRNKLMSTQICTTAHFTFTSKILNHFSILTLEGMSPKRSVYNAGDMSSLTFRQLVTERGIADVPVKLDLVLYSLQLYLLSSAVDLELIDENISFWKLYLDSISEDLSEDLSEIENLLTDDELQVEEKKFSAMIQKGVQKRTLRKDGLLHLYLNKNDLSRTKSAFNDNQSMAEYLGHRYLFPLLDYNFTSNTLVSIPQFSDIGDIRAKLLNRDKSSIIPVALVSYKLRNSYIKRVFSKSGERYTSAIELLEKLKRLRRDILLGESLEIESLLETTYSAALRFKKFV